MSFTRWIVVVCVWLLVPVTASAQNSGWEVEVHGGGSLTSNPSGGTSSLPGSEPLPPLPFGIPDAPSRRVSSWFFGDGAQLANGTAAQLQGFAFPFSARITALDSVLAGSLAERQNGGSFGFRVSRDLTPRFGVEFNVDFSSTPLDVTQATSIQASTESFAETLEGMLQRYSGPLSVQSSHDIRDDVGSQISATGALNINLLSQGRVIPYATVGAGVVSNRGHEPEVDV